MIVVGPEEPLVNGLYDFFKSQKELKHIYFIGPSKKGAMLEGSKAFAKAFMQRHNIPTASYREFTSENYEEGVEYLKNHPLPIAVCAPNDYRSIACTLGIMRAGGVVMLSDDQPRITPMNTDF